MNHNAKFEFDRTTLTFVKKKELMVPIGRTDGRTPTDHNYRKASL